VEQAHGSAAVLHRFHPDYGLATLATRATLHQCRHLWLDPPEAAKEQQRSSKISRLARKAPEKVSGKHAFLGHMLQSARDQLPAGAKMPLATIRHMVKEHGRLFQALPAAGQAALHREALETSQSRAEEVQAEIAHIEAERRLGQSRLTAELLEEGILNRVPLARFAHEDYSAMQQLLRSPEFAWAAVAQRRQALAEGPEAPPREVLDALGRCAIYAAPMLEPDLPDWLRRFCWSRVELQDRRVAVTNSLEEGGLAYYFVYATQRPLEAFFKPMALKCPASPCLEGASLPERLDAWSKSNAYTFDSESGVYVNGKDLPFLSGQGVVVLQGLTFDSPGVVVANMYPVALQCFLDLLPSKAKEPKRKPTQDSKASKVVPDADMAQHPWLAEFLSPAKEEASQSSQTVGPHLPVSGEDPLDEEAVLDQVWEGLAEKRREWELQGLPAGEDFTTEVRDWAWTQAQAGKAYFCVAGQAAKGDPSAWRRRYQLSPQVSLSARVYGQNVATALAVEWCRRLQFFYDLYKAQPSRDFAYTNAHKEALQPSDAFLAIQSVLPKGSKAEQRAQAIVSLFPVLK